MSNSERDPLFFPPGKHPEEPDQEGPPSPIIIDTGAQEKALRRVLLLGICVLAALFIVLRGGNVRGSVNRVLASLSGPKTTPAKLGPTDMRSVLELPPQEQAERLMDMTDHHTEGAGALLDSRVDAWRGHIRPTPQLRQLIWTGMNDDVDMTVRGRALEVQLAAFDIPKTRDSVEKITKQVEGGQPYRGWALMMLGTLGNRGVEPDQCRQTLVAYLHDPQEDVRMWSAEALAVLGQDEAIPVLLDSLRSDPSVKVRDRAAAAIAVNGMFTRQQRLSAVPALVQDLEDPAVDAPTRGFIFHIFRDLSHQNLPDDAVQWKQWWGAHPAG